MKQVAWWVRGEPWLSYLVKSLKYVKVTYLDFNKVFDTASHNILADKLISY